MAPDSLQWTVGLVGYGEVGRILAEDLRQQGVAVVAYDVKLNADIDAAMRGHACRHGVVLATSHAEVARAADLIISAVTASQTIAVARACAGHLRPGRFYLDFNSASPNAKVRAGEIVDATGACYVEGAVMTSVPPFRLQVPLLLGGTHAARLHPSLDQLGFSGEVASDRIGVASATKMCRSVIIKGMEAMVIESFTAARAYGVEDAVVASLHETFPGIDWEQQATYFFRRVIQHGRRRAEEMHEAALAVADTGLEPLSAASTALRLDSTAVLADTGLFGERGSMKFAKAANWRLEADKLLKHLRAHPIGPGAVTSTPRK